MDPEERAIKKFAAKGDDQPFDRWMPNRRMGNGVDVVDFDYAQVGESAMKAQRRVMVGAGVLRHSLASARAMSRRGR